MQLGYHTPEKMDKLTKVEKNAGSMSGKPVPMKLFAAWEVDRTPPNCIPR